MRRVVVTGCGVSKDVALREPSLASDRTNEVPPPHASVSRRVAGPASRLLLEAVAEALVAANLQGDDALEDLGVIVSHSPELALEELTAALEASLDEHGEFDAGRFARAGAPELMPLWYIRGHPVTGAALVSMKFGAVGLSRVVGAEGLGGLEAAGEAWGIIRRGDLQAVLCAGSAAATSEWRQLCYDAATHGGRATGENRWPLGEGAAAAVLEESGQADRRRVTPLAEVTGYAAACGPLTGPHRFTIAMGTALREAHREPADVAAVVSSELPGEAARDEQTAVERVLGRGRGARLLGSTALGDLTAAAGLVGVARAMRLLSEIPGDAVILVNGADREGRAASLVLERWTA